MSNWRETESKVHDEGLGLVLFVSGAFFLMGAAAAIVFAIGLPQKGPLWLWVILPGAFIMFGAAVFVTVLKRIRNPVFIRHALRDTLPNCPTEPVFREGSIVIFRLTHELHENADGWQFRESPKLRQLDHRFLFGFGIPFLIVFAAILSYLSQHGLGLGIPPLSWPMAILCGVTITAVCGGTLLACGVCMSRSDYRRLCRLTIPRDDAEILLDLPLDPLPEESDLAEGLKWVFVGPTERRQMKIPRESIRAVQLCPWMFCLGYTRGRTTTTAIQGLLVLAAGSDQLNYLRIPILLTGDVVPAAKLMQSLASVLKVPYLFHADEDGWEKEKLLAKQRPPLEIGGIST